jgi:hypothetical protein
MGLKWLDKYILVQELLITSTPLLFTKIKYFLVNYIYACSYYRILTMVYNFQRFSDFIHRPGIKKQTKEKHDVSETGSVSVLR